MKNLKSFMRENAPSLKKIQGAMNLEGLGSKRNTDGRSIETDAFDKEQVQRWLRHQEWLAYRRNR